MYINKCLLFGNLTRDPEIRALPSGMNVCNFSIATNRTFKDRDGKKQEQTDFHNVVVFGKQADTVNQWLKKGSSVFVEGRMQTRSWEKEGEKKYRTEVVADRVQFGPKSSGTKHEQGEIYGASEAKHDEEEHADDPAPKDEIGDMDIPF